MVDDDFKDVEVISFTKYEGFPEVLWKRLKDSSGQPSKNECSEKAESTVGMKIRES